MRWNSGFNEYEYGYEYEGSYLLSMSPIERSILQYCNNYSEIQVVITNYLFFNDPSTFSPPNSTPPQHHSSYLVWGIYEDRATADSHTNYRELF